MWVIALLWCLFYWIGNNILYAFKKYIHIENTSMRILSSITLGLSVYVFYLFALGSIWYYSLTAVWVWIVLWVIISFPSLKKIFSCIKTPLKEYDTSSQRGSIALFFDEIHYGIITFLLSVNFISVYRPFPIGWDDLGVYMNFPKLLSSAGELLSLWQVYFWQLYTGVGFLAWSQTYAFFLNSFSGIFVALAVYIGINSLRENKKDTIDFWLLGVLILLMMPMTVFQLAKDMKLDFALLWVSITALTLLYHTFFDGWHFSHKKSFWTLTLVWFFVGIAFSIKVTSLLLFIAVFGALSYKKLNIWWFLGFTCVFIWIFTFWNIWSMMNVIVPQDIPVFIPLVFLFAGFAMLVFSSCVKIKSPQVLSHYIIESLCILGGFILALSPWIVKHSIELSWEKPFASVSQIINGKTDQFSPNYELIYSQDEFKKIENSSRLWLDTSGTTNNEDFWRYFWYERGINNYLKLPFNLSFQINQKGEFTDISFLFFALIPVLFLFLPYKNKLYQIPVVIVMVFFLLYFIPGPISNLLTGLFGSIFIPLWYIPLVVLMFAPLLYFSYVLETNKKYVSLFLVHLSAMTLYILLWTISAFWVVWYGIVMYFWFLLMIVLVLQILSDKKSTSTNISIYYVLALVWIYAIASALPHGITNLKSSGYPEYKLSQLTEEESLMQAHPDYYPILWEVNISDSWKRKLLEKYKSSFRGVISKIPEFEWLWKMIPWIQNSQELKWLLIQVKNNAPQISSNIGVILNSMYKDVISPQKEFRSQKNIYRAGTFMKYFISENNARIFEDNLLSNYKNYIHDNNSDISIQRFKKLNIDYILLDLNAATIDNDERKNLTKRYEALLTLLQNKNLEMISTDSTCLRIALDEERLKIASNSYMQIAGINYDDSLLTRTQKKYLCAQKIIEITKDNKLLEKEFPYLAQYQLESLKKTSIYEKVENYLKTQDVSWELTDEVIQTNLIVNYIPIGYKVLMKIKK